MILSLVAIILFGIAVGGWLYVDTRYHHKIPRWSRREANLAIYDERVAEAEQVGTEQQKSDAGHLLLNEVTDDEVDPVNEHNTFVFQLMASVLVCTLGFVGYLFWGDLHATELERVAQQLEQLTNLESNRREQELGKIISHLERRNNSRHRNIASSDYLIFAYSLSQDFAGVIRTHKFAEYHDTTSLHSDLERIQAEVTIAGELTDEARRVASRVLEAAPDQPSLMQLFGIDSFREQDYVQARNFFERGIRNTGDPSRSRILEELLNRTNEQLHADHIGIRLTVDVQSLSAPNLWLTVFAQTGENDPPVAVVQRPFVREIKYNIVLDDAVAMLPEKLLSDAHRVRVIARLTPSQEIFSENAIQEVSSGWLDPSTLPKVSLQLADIVVADGIAVSVNLGAGITVEDDATVFIIGRAVASSNSDPPLIVKRVLKRDLPLDVLLTVEDAMLPLEKLPTEGLEVYARLSKTGNTTRAENDIESDRSQVQVGESIRLTLDRVIQEMDLMIDDSETDT